MTPGDLQSLLVNGVIGVGGILVFLPQICILFLRCPFWKTPATCRARRL